MQQPRTERTDHKAADKRLGAKIVDALRPLARLLAPALAPLVAEELRSKAKGDDTGDPWIHQGTSPLGKRAHCRACAEGKIEGAYKLKRRWLAKRSAIDAFIQANGAAARGMLGAARNDTDDGEPTAAEIAAELARANLAFAPRRGARR